LGAIQTAPLNVPSFKKRLGAGTYLQDYELVTHSTLVSPLLSDTSQQTLDLIWEFVFEMTEAIPAALASKSEMASG
jgi:hypothetical protein